MKKKGKTDYRKWMCMKERGRNGRKRRRRKGSRGSVKIEEKGKHGWNGRRKEAKKE